MAQDPSKQKLIFLCLLKKIKTKIKRSHKVLSTRVAFTMSAHQQLMPNELRLAQWGLF